MENKRTEHKQGARGKGLIPWVVVVALVAVVAAFVVRNKNDAEPIDPTVIDPVPSGAVSTTSSPIASDVPRVSIIAENFTIPWDIAFLPGEGMLITERKGTIIHLKADGSRASIKLPRPAPKGEGGLLGIVLHPDFKQNRYLYIYMTTAEGSTGTKNAVFRYVFSNGLLENEKTIISNIPGALYHDGGRLEFGPDDLLYITTGDSQSPDIAQDLASLGGKILRLTDEGSIPAGNPFNTAVYSYGHRNPQGLAWDTQGNLWSTEHGRSGVTSGYDELNLIKPGGNYGWPTIEGPASKQGMISPVIQSGADDTWAPASLVYLNGKLYFGGLRGESLYEATVANGTASNLKEYFNQEFGRIRTVRVGPDGMLYLTTSNRDGRGTPKAGDDKVIRVNPKLL